MLSFRFRKPVLFPKKSSPSEHRKGRMDPPRILVPDMAAGREDRPTRKRGDANRRRQRGRERQGERKRHRNSHSPTPTPSPFSPSSRDGRLTEKKNGAGRRFFRVGAAHPRIVAPMLRSVSETVPNDTVTAFSGRRDSIRSGHSISTSPSGSEIHSSKPSRARSSGS